MRNWILTIGGMMTVILSGYTHAQARPNLDEAITLYEAQRYTESLVMLQNIITHDPSNATAQYYLGQVYLQQEDYDNAIEHCKQAIYLEADSAEHYFCLGRSYGEKARRGPIWKRAVLAPKIRSALEQAVLLNPYHVQARLGLTHFYMRAPALLGGSLEKAYAQARILTELSPAKGKDLLDKIRHKLGVIATH